MSVAKLFDRSRVVVVGGGRGLGRQYCLDLGQAGADVLVASQSDAALTVVDEIRAAGGAAHGCVSDARDGDRIAAAAREHIGGIDAMIVNAGVVRDRSFGKMGGEEWSDVMSVHVDGAFACCRAVWDDMRQQGQGSIVLTTSGAGLHGNFGQANYAAAKGAIIALAKSLATEGKRAGIRVNAVAPMALTEMTEDVFTPELKAALDVERVSPFVLALLHRSNSANGLVIETGGGWAAAMRWERSRGLRLDAPGVDAVLERWDEIVDFAAGSDWPKTTADSLSAALGAETRDQPRHVRKMG